MSGVGSDWLVPPPPPGEPPGEGSADEPEFGVAERWTPPTHPDAFLPQVDTPEAENPAATPEADSSHEEASESHPGHVDPDVVYGGSHAIRVAHPDGGWLGIQWNGQIKRLA